MIVISQSSLVRTLQWLVAIGGLVPVLAGVFGMGLGAGFIAPQAALPIPVDSHWRYLSGPASQIPGTHRPGRRCYNDGIRSWLRDTECVRGGLPPSYGKDSGPLLRIKGIRPHLARGGNLLHCTCLVDIGGAADDNYCLVARQSVSIPDRAREA